MMKVLLLNGSTRKNGCTPPQAEKDHWTNFNR